MISIVAHGIMGTAYRQDVVVEYEGMAATNQRYLKDVRRLLSSQYGDDTPMTGWALQPASDGIWLSRIERAFDANYAPAYVMVSFLIPQGKTLNPKAQECIVHHLLANHAKYIQQSVVQYKPNWGFLHLLGRELEGMIENATTSRVASTNIIQNGNAFWSRDISSMLRNIWDSRFSGFDIIFCGDGILSPYKEFTPIDDIVSTPNTTPDKEESVSETVPPAEEEKPVGDEPVINPVDESYFRNEEEPLSDFYYDITDDGINDEHFQSTDNVNNDNIPPSKKSIFKTTLVTLAAAAIALVVGLVSSVLLNIAIFRPQSSIGGILSLIFLVAAIGMFSYFIGYRIFHKERWPHKRIAIIVGISLALLIVGLLFATHDSWQFAYYLIYILYSAMLSMLTYTLAFIVFKHSGLTQFKWVNWSCFVLTFLWCLFWCCIIGVGFVIED